MSFPTIPEIAPTISLDRNQVVNLLLASVALEELSLAHIVNTEGEKLQAALGTLPGSSSLRATSLLGLLSVNREVRRTLQTVLMKEMLLEFKLEDILDISIGSNLPPRPPTPPVFPILYVAAHAEITGQGTAWGVETPYGSTGNAQYITLNSTQIQKTVKLGLGKHYDDVGTVTLIRLDGKLSVTFATISPYLMNKVHLYVGYVPPTTTAPGQFPYQYDPGSTFTTYTFIIDLGTL